MESVRNNAAAPSTPDDVASLLATLVLEAERNMAGQNGTEADGTRELKAQFEEEVALMQVLHSEQIKQHSDAHTAEKSAWQAKLDLATKERGVQAAEKDETVEELDDLSAAYSALESVLSATRLQAQASLDKLKSELLEESESILHDVEERSKRLEEWEAELEVEAVRLEGGRERQGTQLDQLQKEGAAREEEAAARIAGLEIELVESVSVMADEAAARETQSAVKIAELEIELGALRRKLVETQQTEVAVVSAVLC